MCQYECLSVSVSGILFITKGSPFYERETQDSLTSIFPCLNLDESPILVSLFPRLEEEILVRCKCTPLSRYTLHACSFFVEGKQQEKEEEDGEREGKRNVDQVGVSTCTL